MGIDIFLWLCIIVSSVGLLAYEIWNAIVVGKDFASLARESREKK